ncbi:MAG: hypothetical protein JNL28_03240 [Planctomycetes bacterium]|nr:hypothetical protein [Planctomycetota bacterium]
MKHSNRLTWIVMAAAFATAFLTTLIASPAPLLNDWKLIGWNDLGMHCMDSDYSVFSILPPYNTINAQVVDQAGQLIDVPAGTTVSYRGVADPTGSINVTSAGKTNYWQHVLELFGANVAVDQGLAGNDMPGLANTPRAMTYEPAHKWFTAVGIPITPTDDAGRSQSYPMMQLQVRDPSGTLRGTTNVVLPVSSEMDCRACHASGAGPEARPLAGWINERDYERDYRLNILRLHDEKQAGNPDYTAALANFGFHPNGLFETVTVNNRSILCASCHGTNALGSAGFGPIKSLTSVIHTGHATVTDPVTHMSLGSSSDRSACYRCHPGSETRCLRGTMGNAVAADGSMEMQCQSCHGHMAQVGDPARAGWFQEPSCQNCHTGTATVNNGQIRYDTAFEPNGLERVAVSAVFATNPNTPAPGLDLYRFSAGHGGLQCEACHGSTHAEYPSAHANDNLQSIALQGHSGVLADCTACHASMPNTVTGGPHGMHPISANWAEDHADVVEHGGVAQCRVCHGTDLRGTVLSRALGDRSFNNHFGLKQFWKGYQIGCYECHNGPNSSNATNNHAPTVTNAAATTPAGVSVPITLSAADSDGNPTTLRIVKQPANGTVSLAGTQATYHPYAGFAGTDSFAYAASDGSRQSPLGTVTVSVTANWDNYGEGTPGTNGVPVLTLGAVPRLGTAVPIFFGNSSGVATSAIVFVSQRPGYQPTPFGTQLLAQPGHRVLFIGATGTTRFFPVTADPAAIGANLILQTMIPDPGSATGRSMSRAMRMVFGL